MRYNSDMKSARTRVVPYEWKLKEGEWTRAMEGQEEKKRKKKRPEVAQQKKLDAAIGSLAAYSVEGLETLD